MHATVTFHALIAALITLMVAAPDAAPQMTYPAKPIRVIAPSAAGSPPDVIARMVSDPLAAAFGQPVIVDNRPGAMGTIGLAALAKADPDGHTLGVVSLPSVVAPSLLARMPYDTARDLAPVQQLIWSSNLLIVRASAPYMTLAELVAAAKARPGQIRFASGGNGTPAHLSGELFKIGAGIDLQHIPFKGTVPGVAAVLGEQVDMMFATAAVAAGHIKAGKLRALATSAPVRSGAFPDVLTMHELGYDRVAVRDWLGIAAPAATPKPVIQRIASEVGKVLAQPELRGRLSAVGYDPVAESDPQAFARLMQSEAARWANVVREAGIKVD